MSDEIHEHRIVSRCREIYSGCNVTPEWAAETCGLTLEQFMVHYEAYIRRLTRAIETKQEWFLLAEWEYLLRAGNMRPQQASSRFKAPQENIENWLKEKEKTGEEVNWHDMRLMRKMQGNTDEEATE